MTPMDNLLKDLPKLIEYRWNRVHHETLEYCKKLNSALKMEFKQTHETNNLSTNSTWAPAEHALFLEGCEKFGDNYKEVAKHVKTKSILQVQNHLHNATCKEKAKKEKIENNKHPIPVYQRFRSLEFKKVMAEHPNIEFVEISSIVNEHYRTLTTTSEGRKLKKELDEEYEKELEVWKKLINHGKWTSEEQALFLEGVKKSGAIYREIAKHITHQDKDNPASESVCRDETVCSGEM